MSTYTRDAPTTTRPPVKQRRLPTGRTIAIGVLGLVVIVFILGTARHYLTPTPPAPTEQTQDPAVLADGKAPDPTTAPTAAAQSPACSTWATTPTDTPDLINIPTQWTLVGGMAAPSDPAAGPALTTPVRSCYARTPAGALFAVANYLAQMQDPTATPASEITLATTAMNDTPARAKFIQQWSTGVIPTVPPTVVDIRAAFDAFHFIDYSPDLAMVDLASTFNGKLDAAVYTVRYINGSWLLDPPDTGRWAMRQLPVEVSTYWTHWSAT